MEFNLSIFYFIPSVFFKNFKSFFFLSVETGIFPNIWSPQSFGFMFLFPLLALFEMRLEDKLRYNIHLLPA